MASSGQKPGFWPPARNLRNRVFFPFLRLHGVFWAKTRFLATRASSDGIAKFSLLIQPHPFNHPFDEQQ
jgi:hypothetical protein